ncbi:MAG: CDP-glycerol:poly(Glycerophosphate) glycerophosphotransferase [Virgibacillus proomii]|jgi:CDP-ribitol ribitolphosphotransferase / teichoic acid ribitol-phosphate polymerase
MHYISIVNEKNNTNFLISKTLSVQVAKIKLDNRDIRYHFKDKNSQLTEIVFEDNLNIFPANTFLTLEFFDKTGSKICVKLDQYGNFPVNLNHERFAIFSQVENELHITIKFIDFRALILQMQSYSPIVNKVYLENSDGYIKVSLSNLEKYNYKNIILTFNRDNSLNAHIIPVLVKDDYVLISKEDLSAKYNIHLLLAINSNVFKLSLNNLIQINAMELEEIKSYDHFIEVKENDLMGVNINNIVQPQFVDSCAYIETLNIENNFLVLNVEGKEWFMDLENPILILQEIKSKNLFAVKGKVRSSFLYFNLENFLEYIPMTKENWNIYLMNKGNRIAFKLNNKREKVKNDLLYILNHTNFPSLSTYNLNSAFLFNENKDLIIRKDKVSNLVKSNYKIKTTVKQFKMYGSRSRIKIQLQSTKAKFIILTGIYLVHRNKDNFTKIAVEMNNLQYKSNFITFECNVDFKKKNLFPLYWDIFVGIDINGEEELIKVTNVSNDVFNKVDSRISRYQLKINKDYIVYPYITINKDLAFTFRKKEYFENRYYLLKENIAFIIFILFKDYFSKKEIWIGFEKLAMSAHDSGYYFFDYVYKNSKHDDFYYVIRKDSPELNNLKDKKDKLLYFMSFKYFIYMFAADLLISSDTKRNSYSLKQKKTKLGKALTNKRLVYLQHGVNGLKAVPDFYKKRDVFDLVIAPSEYEKKMITEHWGYDESEVVTTGLARWDVLKDRTKEIDYKQIFVMPTWRTWMEGMSKEDFVKSQYYMYYNDFLSSTRLNKVLRDNNVKIKFFLHPKFKDYIDLFEINSPNIEKFGFLEVPLDEMIMKSSMMISDYSSVIWEMFYLKKPCLFYHFDVDKYLQYEGSYMNFEIDLFGDIAYNPDELIRLIEYYICKDFKEKEKYGKMRSEYFTYMDNQNSKRIFEAIENKKKDLYKKGKDDEIKISHIIPFYIRRKVLNAIARVLY